MRNPAPSVPGPEPPLPGPEPPTRGPAVSVLDRAWTLHEQVALRPEPFGALAYHFGTRRLSFLKSPVLLSAVQALHEHPTARAACLAAGVSEAGMASYERALSTLAETGMICERRGAP
jgi:putative mycofactocin binding protein MftB